MKPQVGQLLYRGCSCDEFGRITRVETSNGKDFIDIELVDADINELYFPVAQVDKDSPLADPFDCNTTIELPPNTKVKIIDVQYISLGTYHIQCRISTGGCYRCTESFYFHDEGKQVRFE